MFTYSVLFFAIVISTVAVARNMSPERYPQAPQRRRQHDDHTLLSQICKGRCIRHRNGTQTGCHPRCQCVVTPKFGHPNTGLGNCTHALLSKFGK
uniref:8 kDa Amblyomma family member n=1 Tax=Rhipicephalus appendiculatus TaxID=34631 RepID=A0A131YFM3_RHIAP